MSKLTALEEYMQRFNDSPPFWAVGNNEALRQAIQDGVPLEEDLGEDPDNSVA